MLISKLGQGVFLAVRQMAIGSGFEHAGGKMGKIFEKYNVFEKLEKRNMENDNIL